MPGAERGTNNEEGKRHQHPRITTAYHIERTGGAAAAELHADPDKNAPESTAMPTAR